MELAPSPTNPGGSSKLLPKSGAVRSRARRATAELPDRESADDRAETVKERLKRLKAHKRNALHRAAKRGKVDDVKFLIQHGHSVHEMDTYSYTVLHMAAKRGRVDVIAELLRNGAEVDARNPLGNTALLYAVMDGHLGAVHELIKHGAAVNVADIFGRTPLFEAASSSYIAVIRKLIKHGADVHATDEDGQTVLHWAVAMAKSDVVAELLASGADPTAETKDGRTALSIAIQCNKKKVKILLLATFFDKDTSIEERVELFRAATMGNLKAVKKLVKDGEPVDAITIDGRTPLFFAAEFGRKNVVKSLLKLGASVAKQSVRSDFSLGGETPLTLAGRAGHMEIFEALIKAGASVNVRSRDNGETPLISAARWGFAAGVQLLVSNGGALRVEDGPEANSCSLISGTLETMKSLCSATIEFKLMCGRIVMRLQDMCSQLQALNPANVQDGALVTFANILIRFCRLQLDIEKRQMPLFRFIGSRVAASKIYDFHEELDHFAELLGLTVSLTGITAWKAQWRKDQSLLSKQFEVKLADNEALMRCFVKTGELYDSAVLLQSELVAHAREGNAELQEAVRSVCNRVCKMVYKVPDLPVWFISHEDVELHSWRLVWSNRHIWHYESEWRKTSVKIETCDWQVGGFASCWFELSHPNVVKLLGACDLRDPCFVVYELVPGGRHLLDFLHEGNKSNRDGAVWECLRQAALGLRYIHNRGLAHGELRPEHILVGSNLVTKLCGLYKDPNRFSDDWRPSASWTGPEYYKEEALLSAASDIYAFGMCIWEAVTLKLPWKDMEDDDIKKAVMEGKLPERPSIMTDDEWNLITRMCRHDPAERVDINFVVNRLDKFVFDSKQRFNTSEVQSQNLKEHLFGELGGETIPKTLKSVAYKCDRLSEEQWMSKSVFPALNFIFDLLQRQQMTASDIEAVQFCAELSRFQRHLRTTVSNNSTYRCARSLKVAESNGVIYAELDRLLDMLNVSADDPIRQWRHNSMATQQAGTKLDGPSDIIESSSRGISVDYCDSPFANHELWKRDGLLASSTTPSWYLPRKDLQFDKSDQIGQGAFGEVFKGSWLGTPVVVKFMGYEGDKGTIPTNLLLHEVRVWHHLNHPHVLRFYGANHKDNRYFVCELASGGDLLDFLEKPDNKKLAWQKLYETALGLQYLHGQNVAHNDLKCDNIMVDMDGNAKLIDFGLSCLLNEAEIKIDIKKMGAVNWRSPEYLAGERPSFASDVYSFAMCIIEVVSGDAPWGKRTEPAFVKVRVKKGVLPALPTSMNDKQRNLIKLMTKFEPSERVRMAFVVDKLNEIAREESLRDAAP